jgi:3-deoxy-manno-octulosonate cytidylyltransferase (CMP-KDO synthetase)
MKIAAFIPARLASTRLPNKLIQPLGVHSVIATTYLNVAATKLFAEVRCITDSQEIAKEIELVNGLVSFSSKEFETGTDRIAEFAHTTDADIIMNVQGDEPFVNKAMLQQLIDCFQNPITQVASVMMQISEGDAANPNNVKVIVDANNHAILFSRSKLPFNRDNALATYYKHIGIYAFRKQALIQFAQLPQPDIEKIEKLENLRLIYHGIPIAMVETKEQSIGIDTLEDLEKARTLLT